MAGFKGITINTPPEQAAHIYAEDDGAVYAAIVGGSSVFAIGKQLKATIISNNKVRIEDGVIMVGGRFGRIPYGEYVDVTIENGTAGKKRNDMIVCRLETTGTGGADTFSIEVKKGVPGTSATDPSMAQNDIYNGGRIYEFPLYRVRLDGINITGVDQRFNAATSIRQVEASVSSYANDANTKIRGLEDKCFKLISSGGEMHKYKIGNEINIVGTMVKNSTSDWVELFNAAQLRDLLGEEVDFGRFSITTYNGDAANVQVRFYQPDWWNGIIYQYFYPKVNGSIRINYHMKYLKR